MTILINSQSLEKDSFYHDIKKISQREDISCIFLTSSLMHDLEDDIVKRYNNIENVELIKTNSLFTISNFSNQKFTLNKDIIKAQENIYSNVLSSLRWLPILSRIEQDSLSFTMSLYYDVYNFWNIFFQKNRVDSVISLLPEHSSLDTILIDLAVENRVKNVLTITISGWQAFLNEEYFSIFDNINKKNIPLDTYDNNFFVRTDYDYSCQQIHSDKYRVTLKNKLKIYKKKIFSIAKDRDNSILEKIVFLNKKVNKKIKTKILLSLQIQYIKKLRQFYERNSLKSIDFNKKYVYYCLHFDPEATTLPKDKAYSNQLLNIRILSSALPDGWKLYVKEHPHQLNIKLYKNIFLNQLHSIDFFRSKSFYKYINSLDNVELVSLDINHKECIANAEFIASNTGTVFREATILKKRCITFSYKSIYTMLDNVFIAKEYEDCIKIFNNSSKPKFNSVDELFSQYTIAINDLEKRDSILLNYIIDNQVYKVGSND